jgi:hypothetical protein
MTDLLERKALHLSTDLFQAQFTEWVDGGEGIEYRLPNAHTFLIFQLADGRRERFDLAPLCDMEYTVFEPVTRPDGHVTIPLEVNRFENSAVSQVLWPGERLIVRGGVRTHPDARPIYGTVQIPAGAALEDGCLNRQTLWSRFWTPLGELTMAFPANMSGVVTRLTAPLGTQLYADRPIPLHDGEGEHVGTIYDCSNIEFMSPPPSNE